jgi:ferritin-like metal-binding protein YciE
MTLFVHQLRDIYYAEKQIVQSLPEMIEKATDSNLKRGFETHLGETKNHVNRLEQVFKMHGVEAKGIDFTAMGLSRRRHHRQRRRQKSARRSVDRCGACRGTL